MKALKILSLILIMLLSVGCGKDDDEPTPKEYAEENPLAEYLAKSGFGQATTNHINQLDYEFGLKFTPLVKGKIKAVTFKIPDAAANVRVTIWDASAKTVLRTETIASVTANTEVVQNITPLELEKDKMYMITYNGNDWYRRRKTDESNAVYPIKAGNININGYSWIDGTAQTFPTVVSNNYYAGDLSFVFQQTE